jgi:hypothetical protein
MISSRRVLQTAVSGAATVAIAAILALSVTPARARAAACGPAISDCCKIISPGSYSVPADFSTSATGVCIDIAASGVTLTGTLANYTPPTISGPGDTTSSKGIVIEPTARQAIISDLEVSGFGLGMAVDGPRAVLLEVLTDSNGQGKVINAARAYLNFADAGNNLGFGLKATANATNLTIVQTFSRFNGAAGFQLRNVRGAHLNGVLADGNGSFGIWLDGASANSIVSFEANDNSIAGVYLGCDKAGPNGVPCPPWRTPSNRNLISGVWVVSNANATETDSTASASNPDTPGFGVAIDTGSVRNLVTLVTSQNHKEDMFDENTDCASNIWQSNTFTTSSPAAGTTPFCIN